MKTRIYAIKKLPEESGNDNGEAQKKSMAMEDAPCGAEQESEPEGNPGKDRRLCRLACELCRLLDCEEAAKVLGTATNRMIVLGAINPEQLLILGLL